MQELGFLTKQHNKVAKNMKRILIPLMLFILIFIGCEKDKEVTPLKSKVKTIKNDLGTISIRIYYDNDLVKSIVLINCANDVISLTSWGYADSIEWFYNNGQIDYGISHKRSDVPAPYYNWGYQIDSVTTNKIYLIRDEYDRVIEKIDSLTRNMKTEYRYNFEGKFIGINGLLTDTLQYNNENVSKFSNASGYTEFLEYDNTYNPYKTINDLLGFPFFIAAIHNSKNNCIKIKTVFNGDEVIRDIPIQYDENKRVIKVDIDRNFEYYE